MNTTPSPSADPVTTGLGASTTIARRMPRPAKIALAGVTACTVAVAAALAMPYAAGAASANLAASSRGIVSGQGAAQSYGSWPGTGGYGSTTSTVVEATAADAEESTGIVLIDTVLGYSSSAAAGTGMVLTSDGLVLTNNHVVESSTEITVTIASTGESYTATVVGTDAADDVALLQLDGAAGLATVSVDEDAESVGDEVTAVGNAEGGGILMAADGEITALDASVTTAAEGTVDSETLEGTIEIAADVVAGDSGGAVLDAEGEVIGMTTAASSLGGVGYAIDIDDALAIVEQILAGDESDGVLLGYPAFLGVGIAQTASTTRVALPGSRTRQGGGASTWSETATTDDEGVTISGVYDGTPAQQAGLAAGDTITAIDGTAVTDADALSSILEGYDPGDSVTLTWTDTSGETQAATVTLIAGPV